MEKDRFEEICDFLERMINKTHFSDIDKKIIIKRIFELRAFKNDFIDEIAELAVVVAKAFNTLGDHDFLLDFANKLKPQQKKHLLYILEKVKKAGVNKKNAN